MSNVTCPYCNADQEIDHEDGYGYEEGEKHEQECFSCEAEFTFTTDISYSYNVYCNDEAHVMSAYGDKWEFLFKCENCSHTEWRKDKPA
jgi:glutaredoxin